MRNKKTNSRLDFVIKNNILSKSKRSQSHVEIILSFVIFVGFLLVVFIFINPFAKTKEPSYIIDNIQRAVIENISSEIGKLSVVTNGTGCYEFVEEDYEGNYLEVDEGNGKFIIYFNVMFSNTTTKKDCSPLNYTLGVYSKQDMIVYEKIVELKASYENYNSLKSSLGIINDFLFKIKNINGDEIGLSVDRRIPTGIDVEAREIPIRVINSTGGIQELILNIRAW